MKKKWVRQRGCFGKLFYGAVLGLGCAGGPLYAQALPQQTIPLEIAPSPLTPLPGGEGLGVRGKESVLVEPGLPAYTFGAPRAQSYDDPSAPAWCDPVSRVPNLFGGFFATGLQGSKVEPAMPLHFSGAGAEGGVGVIVAPLAVTGPKGPYTLTKDILFSGASTFSLPQNPELTALVRTNFPGATFDDGGGKVTFTTKFIDTFFYNYTAAAFKTSVFLPDPAGGGLVGRNLYFENGSALPQDRVYFFYNFVGNYQLSSTAFDVNRYVFGVEKTFLDGRVSVEFRVPFAGTANNDQSSDQALSVDHLEFGNLGLAFKGVVYRTSNFVTSVGLGLSLPTASDSRMLVAGTPVIEIQNRTCLLQPLLGVAWAPTDRFYAQGGLQFDLDPSGNPVQGLNSSGGLSRIGILNDQSFAYLNAAAGYWVYRGNGSRLTGVALQTEFDYYRSFGNLDTVQSGNLTVADTTGTVNMLNITPGAIIEFGGRTRMAIGVSVPVSGDRLYNWCLTAQLNYNF